MAARRRPLIALLSDFGTRDWYVGSLKAVILSRCPDARLLDITHEIPPYDVAAGAFTLAAVAPYVPDGAIVACVVDPGVGTARALLAVRTERHTFLGPDNGLLSLALDQARRRRIVRLDRPAYWLPRVSRTFHGRDIVAPVAAYLASGGSLARLGPVQAGYQLLPLPRLRLGSDRMQGCVLHIDAFGNLITNLPASLATRRPPGEIRYQRRTVPVVSSYGSGPRGRLCAVVGGAGYLELALYRGSAARRYRAKVGDRVEWHARG